MSCYWGNDGFCYSSGATCNSNCQIVSVPPQGCYSDGYGGCTDYGCGTNGSSYRCINTEGGCQCLYDYYKDGCAIDRLGNGDCVSYGGCDSCGKYYDWLGYPYCWCQRYDMPY
jgi:hypothetical protein